MIGQIISTIAVIIAGAIVIRLIIWSIWRAFSPRSSRTERSSLFFLLAGFILLAMRSQQIIWNHEINPDESQMLAQGLRFLSHPVPWRDVDGTTSGPLNSLLLTLPMYFDAPASWQTGRMVLWALIFLTLIFTYLSLRCFGSRLDAEIALMPTLLFFAFTLDGDFNHYCSEMPSVALLSAGMYLLAREWCGDRSSRTRWFLLGLLMGSVPFAKLQASPVALFLVLVGMAQMFVRFRASGEQRKFPWRDLAALCLGGVLVPGLIMGVVFADGAFGDFWKSYILSGSAFTAQESILTKLENLGLVLVFTLDFMLYFIGAMAALLLAFIPWRGAKARLGDRLFWPLIVIVADCLCALLCILVAGKHHYHYALLLVPPFAILFGISFLAGKTIRPRPDEKPSRAYVWWVAAFSILTIGVQFYKVPIFMYKIDKYVRHGHALEAVRSPVGELLLQASRPGDTMSVWGWMPGYYVETGIPPATRDALCHYMIDVGPQRDYYRNRYLTDLERARPALFVDAISDSTFQWPGSTNMTHECFPELANYINGNYTLWRSVRMTNDIIPITTPVRIYLIKQRAAELHATPAELTVPLIDPPGPP